MPELVAVAGGSGEGEALPGFFGRETPVARRRLENARDALPLGVRGTNGIHAVASSISFAARARISAICLRISSLARQPRRYTVFIRRATFWFTSIIAP